MEEQSNNDEATRIVQLTGSWGGLMPHELTKEQTLELLNNNRWAYSDGTPLLSEEVDAQWETIGELILFPSLVGGGTLSPHVGEEE